LSDIALTQVPDLPKAGLKGPRAAAWLAERGIAVPPRPNSWTPLLGGGLIARLAETEFFIEGGPAAEVGRELENAPSGVYPVLRQDMAITLTGKDANQVLLQTCSVDFAAAEGLVLTSLAGVPVLVIAEKNRFRIWADPSFGHYLWETLQEIVTAEGSLK
jgi:sarcosine oxidase, subunit gamma